MPAVASSERGLAARSSAGCGLVNVPELRRRRSSYCTASSAPPPPATTHQLDSACDNLPLV